MDMPAHCQPCARISEQESTVAIASQKRVGESPVLGNQPSRPVEQPTRGQVMGAANRGCRLGNHGEVGLELARRELSETSVCIVPTDMLSVGPARVQARTVLPLIVPGVDPDFVAERAVVPTDGPHDGEGTQQQRSLLEGMKTVGREVLGGFGEAVPGVLTLRDPDVVVAGYPAFWPRELAEHLQTGAERVRVGTDVAQHTENVVRASSAHQVLGESLGRRISPSVEAVVEVRNEQNPWHPTFSELKLEPARGWTVRQPRSDGYGSHETWVSLSYTDHPI